MGEEPKLGDVADLVVTNTELLALLVDEVVATRCAFRGLVGILMMRDGNVADNIAWAAETQALRHGLKLTDAQRRIVASMLNIIGPPESTPPRRKKKRNSPRLSDGGVVIPFPKRGLRGPIPPQPPRKA